MDAMTKVCEMITAMERLINQTATAFKAVTTVHNVAEMREVAQRFTEYCGDGRDKTGQPHGRIGRLYKLRDFLMEIEWLSLSDKINRLEIYVTSLDVERRNLEQNESISNAYRKEFDQLFDMLVSSENGDGLLAELYAERDVQQAMSETMVKMGSLEFIGPDSSGKQTRNRTCKGKKHKGIPRKSRRQKAAEKQKQQNGGNKNRNQNKNRNAA